MKSCFGYIRVSTAKQGEGASLEAQKDAIKDFASQNGIEIIKWLEELETASKTGRPVFGQMLKDLRCGKADGVVIHRIDRSARNFSDWARLDEVARNGTKVYFAADSLDFDTRGGRLLADIQMALAADYSRNLSIEAKKGLYGRLKQGIYPFRAPLGYCDEGGGKLKSIDPRKAPLVKEIFRLYLSGDHSIDSLTTEMHRRGLTGLGGRPVVRRTIETILNAPFYCGQLLVKGKLYNGQHQPMISVSDYRRIQTIKTDRSGKKSTKHNFQFRGLVRCGRCKKAITGELQKGRVYYRCHSMDCPNRSIREDRLEEQIKKALRSLEIPPRNKAKIASHISTWLEDGGQRAMEKSIKLRISDAKAKEDRLTDLLVEGAIAQPAYLVRRDNLVFEIEQLREELAKLRKSVLVTSDLESLVAFASSFHSIFVNAAAPEKRRLIRNSFRSLNLGTDAIEHEAANWLTELKKLNADHPAKFKDVLEIIEGQDIVVAGISLPTS